MELTWTEALLKFTIAVVDALIVALIPCVVLGVRHLVGWINSRRIAEETDAEQMKREARQQKIEELITTAVFATKQTYVDDLKAKAADGKLTAEERKEAMARALTCARKLMAADGIAFTEQHMSDVLTEFVEEAVARLK